MIRSIKEWQRAAYELAKEKGFHSRECPIGCRKGRHEDMTSGDTVDCPQCQGAGRTPIDPHSPTRIASQLALIHCEISEAVECVARGRMKLYFKGENGYEERSNGQDDLYFVRGGLKPEGFPIELADVFLRLMDFEYATLTERDRKHLAIQCLTQRTFDVSTPEKIAAHLGYLHSCVGRLYNADPFWEDHNNHSLMVTPLWDLHCALFDLARATGVDLLAMAELKHAYNKTRPVRHGGKVL